MNDSQFAILPPSCLCVCLFLALTAVFNLPPTRQDSLASSSRPAPTQVMLTALPVALLAAATIGASVAGEQISPGIETTATVVSLNSTINSPHSERAAAAIQRVCGDKWSANWDDYKYVCDWNHGSYANIFYLRFDGFYEKECNCDQGVHGYDPFGARWTYSESGTASCYARDGEKINQFVWKFDLVDCSTP